MGVFALILSKNTPSYLVGIQYYEKKDEHIFSLFVKLHVRTNQEQDRRYSDPKARNG